MLSNESENIEFKETFVDTIKRVIIAFANCSGGKLYIGVKDDGTIIGLEDPDDIALRISNMIRDSIKPDVTMFVKYETIELEEKKVVLVDVMRGTQRPYYLTKKGMRPEGVYVRQGYSTVSASNTAIRQMIKESDHESFELLPSLEQNLTFESVKKEFEIRNIDFDPQKMRSLNLIKENLYTNLAFLLSDQCDFKIMVGVFEDTDQMIFKDRRLFTGSLLKQLNDVYGYIDLFNLTRGTINKLVRDEIRNYPEIAIREALLNLLIHREYSISANNKITIFTDRIEFMSVGGIVPGVELEDVMIGLSACRNKSLADVFYRLHFIEAYGTGLPKIFKAYEGEKRQPTIETTPNVFKITLPNINLKDEAILTNGTSLNNALLSESDGISNKDKLVEYIRVHGKIKRSEAELLLGLSKSSTNRLLNELVKNDILSRSGGGANIYYILTERDDSLI